MVDGLEIMPETGVLGTCKAVKAERHQAHPLLPANERGQRRMFQRQPGECLE
jgi:hypothetical protein